MTQKQLGKLMGKAQPWISQIENPEYGKWSIATLLDCAEAFDSDLEIKFRPFSRSLYELSHQNEEYFEVRGFEEELPELESAVISGWVANSGRWNDLTRAASLLNPSQEILSPQQGTYRYGQWVPLQRIPRTGANEYQMSTGSTRSGFHGVSPSLLRDVEHTEREKDKRRRAAKGILKRAA